MSKSTSDSFIERLNIKTNITNKKKMNEAKMMPDARRSVLV